MITLSVHIVFQNIDMIKLFFVVPKYYIFHISYPTNFGNKFVTFCSSFFQVIYCFIGIKPHFVSTYVFVKHL